MSDVRRIKISSFTEPVFEHERYGEYVRASDYDALLADFNAALRILQEYGTDAEFNGDFHDRLNSLLEKAES